jgi:hypothetical protein
MFCFNAPPKGGHSMRTSILLAVVAALVFVGDSPTGETKKPAAKRVTLTLSVYEGDPQGTLEAGTIKLLSMPTVTTHEGRAAIMRSGGKVPIFHGDEVEWAHTGTSFSVCPGKVRDGKVDIDIEFELAAADCCTEDRTQISKTVTRLATKVKLGETVKIQTGKKTGKDQRWAELLVEEAKPED